MFIDKDREVIKNDLFNISGRIKAIDRDYFIVRNHTKRRFEIHNKGQIGDTFSLLVPYEHLDQRTIQLVKESRIEYIDKIVAEIEKNNAKLEEDSKNKMNDLTDFVGSEIYRYVNNHESKETIDKGSKFFEGVM